MEIICITSPKGGDGATFCTANIAYALAQAGKKVLAADLNCKYSNLDLPLGVAEKYVFNLSDVLCGRCKFCDAVVEHESANLYFVSSSRTYECGSGIALEMLEMIRKSSEEYDYVIVDFPFMAFGEQVFRFVDKVVYVVCPTEASARLVDMAVSDAGHEENSRIIINKVIPELIDMGIGLNADDLCDLACVAPIGIIPFDAETVVYGSRGEPSASDMSLLSSKAFSNIAVRICGGMVCAVDFNYKSLYYKKFKNTFIRR